MKLPDYVEKLFFKNFGYPKLIIGQVATLSNDCPDIRTMALFNFDYEGRLIFLTNRFSHKWKQLQQHSAISILFLNDQYDVQMIARGDAELLTLTSNRSMLNEYWLKVPQQAKVTYFHKYPENDFIELNTIFEMDTPPESFGMIRVIPSSWETLVIDSENYHKSERFYFSKNNDFWEKKRLNAI